VGIGGRENKLDFEPGGGSKQVFPKKELILRKPARKKKGDDLLRQRKADGKLEGENRRSNFLVEGGKRSRSLLSRERRNRGG